MSEARAVDDQIPRGLLCRRHSPKTMGRRRLALCGNGRKTRYAEAAVDDQRRAGGGGTQTRQISKTANAAPAGARPRIQCRCKFSVLRRALRSFADRFYSWPDLRIRPQERL